MSSPDFYNHKKEYVIRKPKLWKKKVPLFFLNRFVRVVLIFLFAALVGYHCKDWGWEGVSFIRAFSYGYLYAYSFAALRTYFTVQIDDSYTHFKFSSLQIELFSTLRKRILILRKVSAVLEVFVILFSLAVVEYIIDILFGIEVFGRIGSLLIIPVWAILFAIWYISRMYEMKIESITYWSSSYRIIKKIEQKQRSLNPKQNETEMSDDNIIQFSEQNIEGKEITLEGREILSQIHETNQLIEYQLIQLGLRPETTHEISIDLWTEKDDDAGFFPTLGKEGEEKDKTKSHIVIEDIKDNNDNLCSQILLLMELGMLRYSLGILKVTVHGLEMLALPATLFISNIPLSLRALLGKADLSFHSHSYAGAVNICGKIWEKFLQEELLKQDSREGLKAVFDKDFKSKPTLGDLLYYFSAYLQTNLKLNEKEERNIQKRLQAQQKMLWKDPNQNPYRTFYQVASACISLRNGLTHDRGESRSDFIRNSQNIEKTYRLLQYTRMAISEYYSIAGLTLSV